MIGKNKGLKLILVLETNKANSINRYLPISYVSVTGLDNKKLLRRS